MYREQDCGCGGHGRHHGEHHGEMHEHHGQDCGCGGHGHRGEHGAPYPHAGCTCGCHQPQGQMGFQRRFVSREEVVGNLQDYLKQLQAEAKGVEERIAELKKEGETGET